MIANTLTRSGWALVWMRRSTLMKFSDETANRPSVHQPIHGADRTSATPTAPDPTRRIICTRSLASTTRLRSSSVGHSHEPLFMLALRPAVQRSLAPRPGADTHTTNVYRRAQSSASQRVCPAHLLALRLQMQIRRTSTFDTTRLWAKRVRRRLCAPHAPGGRGGHGPVDRCRGSY